MIDQSGFEPGHNGRASGHAERTAHEIEILNGNRQSGAVKIALRHKHGIVIAGLGAVFLEAIGIALCVPELQRIERHRGQRKPGEFAIVKEMAQPVGRLDLHVVARIGHDPLIGLEIAMEHHFPGFRAFHPQIVLDLAAIEEGANLGANDVVDPVHFALLSLSFRHQ